MEKKMLRKFKWFWAWQDEEEENWLREMSQDGWHLSSVGIPTIYDFKFGKPEDFVYRLDYRPHSRMDREDYFQLFEDAGWEHVGEMSGWQYFRKPASAEGGLEIFTDRESKIEKYRRLLGFLIILFLPLLVSFSTVMRSSFNSTWILILRLIITPLLILYAYACVKLFLRIRKLQRI